MYESRLDRHTGSVLEVFLGYDVRESLAYDVAAHSLMTRTQSDYHIRPLGRDIAELLGRPIEFRDGKMWCPISQAPMATEFAIARFAIPIFRHDGWALFADSDVVFLDDVAKLFALADDQYAVMCVKHSQESGPVTKMDGQVQTYYARKNWSSVMLWNCGHPANRNLTPTVFRTWPGRDLHAFKWLLDEEIGELPPAWNVLVGVQNGDKSAKMVGQEVKLAHFTLGGPWLPDWQGGPMDSLWLRERDACKPLPKTGA